MVYRDFDKISKVKVRMQNLFNINWDSVQEISSTNGITYEYFHKNFGSIRVTIQSHFECKRITIEDSCYNIQSVLREYHLKKRELVICTEEEHKQNLKIDENGQLYISLINIVKEYPKNIVEKQNRVLMNLFRIQPEYGENIYKIEPYDCFAKDINEMVFILNILYKKELIFNGLVLTGKNEATMKGGIRIEEKGWIQIEEIEKPSASKQVFVAMWFDSVMDSAFLSVEKACDQNGFKAFRIDNKEHNNEISGEILREIRNSRFLISEVTGQRPGVYFEAGYALALGLHVIWCCKEEELNEVHFDTRQYNHVVWTNEEDLLSKLTNRIKGTIY